jgi:hypothetical protein
MKKALVVLLILAIAGGLFAQEEGLTWSGSIKTGLSIVADDDHNGEDIQVKLNSDDAGKVYRLDLEGTYTKDNYGLKFRLRSDSDYLTTAPKAFVPFVQQGYVWATFVNDIIKLSAGIIDDGAWKTGGLEDYGINGDGLRLEVDPIEGLSLGFMLRAPAPTVTIKQFLSETAFGAKYSTDLFWVAAGLILDSTGDSIESWGGYEDYLGKLPDVAAITAGATDSDHGLIFQAGAGVKPIPGLAISVEAKANNASKFGDYGFFVLDEDVSYKLLDDKLTVGLKSYQYFFGSDWSKGLPFIYSAGDADADESLKPYVKLTPYVGFDVLDSLNVGLEATIGLWKYVYDLDFSIKPKVTYKIGENAKFVAFYNFSSLNFYEDVERNGRKSDKGNTIQFDYIWSF